ncbi:uncharacterized protein AB675_7019 [Cyphellophora attinorum]|uniref:PH domain-containing protein n=1 Tax=Cyphellophora attinorum TaxID=1664694 RepID=A0A0N0NPX8_9EURO|nr:uncharacterized protein AB675_7019 [Phialophora attinorum]KPI43271.1 hypothetical protein AB675_7019 [Phialophora attinorum]
MEATTTTTSPPKFSRYRTVRARAATLQTLSSQSDHEQPAAPPLPKASTFAHADSGVKRAPSRYRRNNAIKDVTSPPLPSAPLPKIQDEHATPTSPSQRAQYSSDRHEKKGSHAHRDLGAVTRIQQHGQVPHSQHRDRSRQNGHAQQQTLIDPPDQRYDRAREEARLILEGEYDRLHRLKKQSERQNRAVGQTAPDLSRRRRSPPRETKGEEQGVADTTKQASTEQEVALPTKQSPATPKQKFARLRQRSEPETAQRTVPVPAEVPDSTTVPAAVAAPESVPPTTTLAAAPAFDAPLSAVNAGDRRVRVRFHTSEITLPVTTSTTAKDLLNSASVVLSNAPDPRTATLLESFTTDALALERPLRRYERIRDVLNSWDSDTQNHLFILGNGDDDEESTVKLHGLDFKDVPTKAGRDITLQMYYASRPGRWDKRWVRLREDGQVTISKNESGLESTNICHLSDFDLYAPTRKLIKRLKPPKKTIFAVKSQQKSAMFLEAHGANFAHFFCSGTKEVADQWYAAVHGWRSWYLVNVLGEGKVPQAGTGEVLGDRAAHLKRPGTSASADTVPYQLGSFKPLLDFDMLAAGSGGSDDGNGGLGRRSTDARHRRGASDVTHGGVSTSPKRSGTVRRGHPAAAPPSSYPMHTAAQPGVPGQPLHAPAHDTAFTGRGLLAAHAFTTSGPAGQHDPLPICEDSDQAFTGQGLLSRHATQRAQGGRGTGRGVAGARPGQPLVDMTPNSDFADGSLLRKLEGWRV